MIRRLRPRRTTAPGTLSQQGLFIPKRAEQVDTVVAPTEPTEPTDCTPAPDALTWGDFSPSGEGESGPPSAGDATIIDLGGTGDPAETARTIYVVEDTDTKQYLHVDQSGQVAGIRGQLCPGCTVEWDTDWDTDLASDAGWTPQRFAVGPHGEYLIVLWRLTDPGNWYGDHESVEAGVLTVNATVTCGASVWTFGPIYLTVEIVNGGGYGY